MTNARIARRSIDSLSRAAEHVEQAIAFGPEARYLHEKLADLRTLLEEFLTGRYQDAALDEALEAIEAPLRTFCMDSHSCCTLGPLETLLTAEERLHRLVNSCLRIRQGLTKLLQHGQLPTVVRAQANLISTQLSTVTVNFETLRQLQAVRLQLLEEAERVRLGTIADGTFNARIHRLAAACSAQQLAADTAIVAHLLEEAEAKQDIVKSHFLKLALRALDALRASHGTEGAELAQCTSPVDKDRRVIVGGSGGGDRAQATGPTSSTRASLSPTVVRVEQTLDSGITSTLAQLNIAAAPQAVRAAQLDALCHALDGPQRVQVAQALIEVDGMSSVLRLVATSMPGQRSAPLRLLAALVNAEPTCSGELLAARGVQVLLHIFAGYVHEARQRADAVSVLRQLMEETASVASTTVNMAGRFPARQKGGPSGGTPPVQAVRRGVGAESSPVGVQAQQQQQQQTASLVAGENAPAGGTELEEEEVCLLIMGLLRQLSLQNAAELVAAGAVKVLCQGVSLHGHGRLASGAATTLSDLAYDTAAVVQMLQERLLVLLADLRLSRRPSEVSAALACITAILEHPAKLPEQHQQHSPGHSQVAQLCAEMGRACDAASVTTLLDLAVDAASAGETPNRSTSSCPCAASLEPGLSRLLPFCVHNTETRTAVLRHSATMQLLLDRVAAAEANAMATLRRVANDDHCKTAVARHLAQLLITKSATHAVRRNCCGGGSGGGSSAAGSKLAEAAAVTLCLADVLRPASRDRSVLRWSSDACSECEQCGLIPPLLEITASPDAACRAAGLACLHALAVYGTQAVRMALGACGAVMALVDAVKLEMEMVPSEQGPQRPPICEPRTLGQAASEALAALATASEALRQDVVMQLAAFLGSSSLHLAASACQALLVLLEVCPMAGPLLLGHGVMNTLVAHFPKQTVPPPAYAFVNDASSMAVPTAYRSRGGGGSISDPAEAAQLLQQRAVRLVWSLCRGGGAAADAAVVAGVAPVLLQRVTSATITSLALRVESAAALAPLLKKSAAVREAAAAGGGLQALLHLAASGASRSDEVTQWDEALGAVAAMAALHAPCRAEAARALRQMLMRGTVREAAAAAVVVERMCSSAAGREAVLAEDMVEPLVRLLSTGGDRTKAAAANAISHLAVPPKATLPPCAASPTGGTVRPRLVLIRAGAISALLALLREAGGDASSSASSTTSTQVSCRTASSSSSGASSQASPVHSNGTQSSPADMALVAAVEALESLATGAEGVQAIRNAGGVEILKATVARGKRRLVPPAVAKAASATLLHCV
ncbi:hypothetical protein VaNZ11_002494 [Volvox africanus]|uniref:Uncharacterized protein n=1 Tax=Volvox africanus TaxID=51714 RepID=A0ABQ5RST2_9CHLO|nr:hypothetical protein VaNZ11_002494 [Volvox africanus]